MIAIRAWAIQEFIGEDILVFVEDGLPGHEYFHNDTPDTWRARETG